MTIVEKMEIVRKALEQGANVSLNFHNCESKEDAGNLIRSFGTEYTHESANDHQWFNIEHETEENGIELEVAAFYE